MLIQRLEQQEAKAKGEQPVEEDKKQEAKPEKKWKQKFIKIWQYNDLLEQMTS